MVHFQGEVLETAEFPLSQADVEGCLHHVQTNLLNDVAHCDSIQEKTTTNTDATATFYRHLLCLYVSVED